MMAMRLGHNRSTVQGGRFPAPLDQQLGQGPGALGDRQASAAPGAGNNSAASERSTAVQEGSMPTIGTEPARAVTVRLQDLRAAIQLSGRYPGQPAALLAVGQPG